MKINIKKTNSQIIVEIDVPGYGDHGCDRTKIKINTNDVRNLLNSKNHNIGKCLQDAQINNKVNCSGTWIFEDASKKAPIRQSPRPIKTHKTHKTKKTTKKLDNSKKDVIIE